ncbi:nitrilase-related carbon-nitrogen hydrolase [Chloroflexota bacterium]
MAREKVSPGKGESLWGGQLPNYELVPLEYDEIQVAAIQMNPIMDVDPRKPKAMVRANLKRMLELCEQASETFAAPLWAQGNYQKRINLVAFPEFTLTGYSHQRTREDWLNIAIEVPGGEEIKAIARMAKKLNCYIEFASHIQEKDWPGHYFNTSMIVDPEGKLIHKHWKAYSGGPGFEWATTVHEVLDEFVDRYGWDAVWPVARTPIGNIATYVCSESFAPENARIFAMKGAEILCLSIAGGGWDNRSGKLRVAFRAQCINSGLWGIYSNSRDGGSMIVDPDGRIMAEALDSGEKVVSYIIPIGLFRAAHSKPYIRTELYTPVLENYSGKYPPNMYSNSGVPKTRMDACRLASKHARW